MTNRKPFPFQYTTPTVPEGPLKELTVEEAERHLLEKLAASTDEPTGAMWDLAQFYKRAGKVEQAFEQFRLLLDRVHDAEALAKILLALGQTAEGANDFEMASTFYREGLAKAPADRFTRYFLHNNLGYSLNQLERYAEGEAQCRRAIEINPDRQNAHKNLGIALAARGALREAAQSFVAATQANAADGRALRLLEGVLELSPELRTEFSEALEQCRSAVGAARAAREEAERELERRIEK